MKLFENEETLKKHKQANEALKKGLKLKKKFLFNM